MSEMAQINIGKVFIDKMKEILATELSYETQPAKIVEYDYKKRIAIIQPLLEIQSYNGESIELQPISDVPVCIPSSKNFTVSIPLQKDDEGIVIFTKLGYDNWFSNGGVQQENIASRGIHNCFFIPGIFHQQSSSDAINNGDDVIYEYEGAEIRFTKDGKLSLTCGQGINILANNIDLLKLIADFVNQVESSFSEAFSQIDKVNTELSTLTTTLASAQYGATPGPTTAAGQLTQQGIQINTQKATNTANANQISQTLKQTEQDAKNTKG